MVDFSKIQSTKSFRFFLFFLLVLNSFLNIKDEEGYKGFNLGYGFGDTSAASENMVFFNNTAYKLDDVEFVIPMDGKKYEYMKEWKFISKSGNIDMTFTPIIDRVDITDVGIIASKQHQVFGKFNGTIKIENNRGPHACIDYLYLDATEEVESIIE